MLETCSFFVSLPLLEQHEGGGFKVCGVISKAQVNLNMLFHSLSDDEVKGSYLTAKLSLFRSVPKFL